MESKTSSGSGGSLKGTIYGDLVGSPYMIENTYDKYFELGEGRRAYSGGRVRSFFPSTTEVSLGSAAVCQWLSSFRDSPTIEHLRECLKDAYSHHPRGGWTEQTRLSLLSEKPSSSGTSDWAAVTRVVPIATYMGGDLGRSLDLSDACVKATCSNSEAVMAGRAITHSVHMATIGVTRREIRQMLEETYGLDFSREEDDLRAELRGEVRTPLEIMGKVIEGAYRYVMPESPAPPSSKVVAEASLRAVLESDSWEDAVRKAVAYGGPSNAVAGIAGGLAETLYGDVTPRIVGKLFSQIPTDLSKSMDAYEKRQYMKVDRDASLYGSISRDVLPIISFGPGRTVYIVPEERKDIRTILNETFPNAVIIAPSQQKDFIELHRQDMEGTYVYGDVPETRTLYIQDRKSIVSPSEYMAPGMPPIQVRRRHRDEFLSLRAWCVDRQREMNRFAGNPENLQIHYDQAYHMWIGGRRIDFFMGDQLAGRIKLDDKGLIKVEQGEYRDLGLDARFENHSLRSWMSRSLFSADDCADPLVRMDNIRESISTRLLDEGGSGEKISNLDRLVRLDEDQLDNVLQSAPTTDYLTRKEVTAVSAESGIQPVKTIYSIGYGRRSEESFLNTLHMMGIDTVVDLRSFPTSRIVPHFNEEHIYPALKKAGIDYISAGDRLGARFSSAGLKDDKGRVDWEKVSRDGDYTAAIEALESLSQKGRLVAIVCSEGNPLTCHRFGLVSRTLSQDGMDVRHILTNGEIVSHQMMEDRMLEKYLSKNEIPSVVSGSYSQQLVEAYRAMNEEYGYKPAQKSLKRSTKWYKL